MPLNPRNLAARLGHDTVRIIDAGGYAAPSGRWVDVRTALAAARAGTVEYSPDDDDQSEPVAVPATAATRISVENATVLDVGRRLAATGPVAALNFASATDPGGGFLGGARAQEESIARSSGLFHCLTLEHLRMYAHHHAVRDAMYSGFVIYSPLVPVFRTDEGDLLEKPWLLSVLTSPAANGRAHSALRCP